jgi:tetratricopeptide (TPR) repeat protein
LRLFDVGKPTGQSDPLAGFSAQHPLFEKMGNVYRTVHSREPFFGPQEFAAEKPPDGYRVFCFGGSTIYGHPYTSETAVPKWLELELRGMAHSRSVEVINCGGVSYASYRLAPIVHEVLQYKPDLIVMATGENEFLEDRTYTALKTRSGARRWVEDHLYSLRTVTLAMRLFRHDSARGESPGSGTSPLSPEVQPRLDDPQTGYASYHRDDLWHRQVISQFADSIRGMIAECKTARVPFFLVTLGSNLRDCPPYKSEHKAGLGPETEARWQALFDSATRADADDPAHALELYRQAEAVDNEYALLAYRIARCLDRQGHPDQARDYYLRAKDQDICPLRMLDEVYRLQYTIAGQTQTPLVDARKILESLSPGGIPGNDIYLDHVHPALGGDQRIAQALAAKVMDLQLIPGAKAWTQEARRRAYHLHFEGLESTYFTNGRRRVEWLENWARRQRLYEETFPKDARGFLHRGFRQIELGEEDAGWTSLQIAMKKDAQTVKQIVGHALELREEGRPEAAESLFRHIEDLVPDPQVKSQIENLAQAAHEDLGDSGKTPGQ